MSVRFESTRGAEGEGAGRHAPSPPRPPPAAPHYYDRDALEDEPPASPRQRPQHQQQQRPPSSSVRSSGGSTAEAERLAAATGAVRSGYLYKLPSSGRLGSWQRRFVVLMRRAIRWYASEMDFKLGRDAKGELRLSESSAITQLVSEGLLVVSSSKQRLTVRAGAGEDLVAWRRDVETQLGALRRGALVLHESEQVEAARRVYGETMAHGTLENVDRSVFGYQNDPAAPLSPGSNSDDDDDDVDLDEVLEEVYKSSMLAGADCIDRGIETFLTCYVGENRVL